MMMMMMVMQHWIEQGVGQWILECLFHLDKTLESLFDFQVITFKAIARA